LIGLLTLPFVFDFAHRKILNTGLLMVFLTMTLFSAGVGSPYYLKKSVPSENSVYYDINGDHIWASKSLAAFIEMVKQIDLQIIPKNEKLLIAPYWPAFYPILQRESPLWHICFLHPQTEKRQKKMIEELKEKEVNWVILDDVGLDGRDDLRFRNTHKPLWQHFRDHFEFMRVMGLPPNLLLLHRKSEGK